jgi:hypothetical protein
MLARKPSKQDEKTAASPNSRHGTLQLERETGFGFGTKASNVRET